MRGGGYVNVTPEGVTVVNITIVNDGNVAETVNISWELSDGGGDQGNESYQSPFKWNITPDAPSVTIPPYTSTTVSLNVTPPEGLWAGTWVDMDVLVDSGSGWERTYENVVRLAVGRTFGWEFMELMSAHDIPTADFSREELLRQVKEKEGR